MSWEEPGGSATRAAPFLLPTVSWSGEMTAGHHYLVTVDLALVNEDHTPADWPLPDQEDYTYTCLLDGGGMFDLWAVQDGCVVLHRFGGSYGPAEFVVIPGEERAGKRSLWLTVLNQWGISVAEHKLPVTVLAPADGQDQGNGAGGAAVSVPAGVDTGPGGGEQLEPGEAEELADALAAGEQDTVEIPYRAVPDIPPTPVEPPTERQTDLRPLQRTRPDLPALDGEDRETEDQFVAARGDQAVEERRSEPSPFARNPARRGGRLSEYYNVAGLRRSAAGALHWDVLPLFSPEARRGDRATFTAYCSPSDERGTVFAVMSGPEPSGRGLQLRSVQSAKIPPGRYQVTAELMNAGQGDIEFLGLPTAPREDPRPWQEITRSVPSRLPAGGGPAHLVVTIETSAVDQRVLDNRLEAARRLIRHVAAEARDFVCYSLISYGPHSLHYGNRDFPEVAAETLDWAVTADDALARLDWIARRGLPRYGYPYAAQLECVLTDLERDLTGEEGRPVIVAVGSRPPHPPRIDPGTGLIPCPQRNDWDAPMTRLRSRYAGIRFGAVRGPGQPDPLWRLLGRDAAVTDADYAYFAPGFAQSLGLTSARSATPIALPLFVGGR